MKWCYEYAEERCDTNVKETSEENQNEVVCCRAVASGPADPVLAGTQFCSGAVHLHNFPDLGGRGEV